MNNPGYCDFSAACRLAREGYSAETIERTLRTESPDLERRKGSDVERYARVTARSALEAHARELQRDRDRDQGWER